MDGRRGSPSRFVSAVPCKKARSETRVGIICHSNNRGYEIKLYLVDIDVAVEGEESSLGVPAVRFVFPVVRYPLFAVCVLESTVYMFGGYDPIPKEVEKVKYARKFELPEKISPNGDVEVEEKELVEIRSMRYSKGLPNAVATPDGRRILVFSTVFRVEYSYRAFEVYDPEENSWEVLPDIPCICGHYGEFDYEYEADFESDLDIDDSEDDCKCLCKITSYGFLDESRFFVDNEVGSCVLDIWNKKWTFIKRPRLVPNLGYFIVAKAEEYDYVISGGTIHCVEGGLSKGKAYPDCHVLPLSDFDPLWDEDWGGFGSSIVSLFNDGVCSYCILQSQLNYSKREVRMSIDICHTSFHTMSTKVKSLRFRTPIPPGINDLKLISL